jgi:hypothetical protein
MRRKPKPKGDRANSCTCFLQVLRRAAPGYLYDRFGDAFGDYQIRLWIAGM